MMATALRTMTATILKVNDHGFQTRETPGTWLNVSKYATPAPEIPPAGTEVEVTLDGSGFVRSIEPQRPSSQGPTKNPSDSTNPGAAPSAERAPGIGATMTRIAVLQAAARFLAARPDAKAADVLTVAARWEAWVGR